MSDPVAKKFPLTSPPQQSAPASSLRIISSHLGASFARVESTPWANIRGEGLLLSSSQHCHRRYFLSYLLSLKEQNIRIIEGSHFPYCSPADIDKISFFASVDATISLHSRALGRKTVTDKSDQSKEGENGKLGEI